MGKLVWTVRRFAFGFSIFDSILYVQYMLTGMQQFPQDLS